jgi:hypothetical protein
MKYARCNYVMRVAGMLVMAVLIIYNKRIDAMLVGLLILLATSRYE